MEADELALAVDAVVERSHFNKSRAKRPHTPSISLWRNTKYCPKFDPTLSYALAISLTSMSPGFTPSRVVPTNRGQSFTLTFPLGGALNDRPGNGVAFEPRRRRARRRPARHETRQRRPQFDGQRHDAAARRHQLHLRLLSRRGVPDKKKTLARQWLETVACR